MEKTISRHIDWLLEMIEKLERYTYDIKNYEEFAGNEKNIDLAIVPLIQIWEITWSLSKIYNPNIDIPFKEIIWFRNILVHTYHKIDPQVIYKIITKSIPILKKKLLEYKIDNNL